MQVNSEKIEKLEELVSEYINKDKKAVDWKITRLTPPNENFGSTILKVDLVLEDDHADSETLSIVAKMLPENEILQMAFNVTVSFKLESAFYSTIVPTLQEFQKEHGVQEVIDFFPKFYGSRNNLNGGDNVDGHAVLLLENLKVSGYKNLDRHIGCDLEGTKFILTDLAKFHAVPLALKILKPDIFDSKVKKYMACFNPIEQIDPPGNDTLLEILEEDEECKSFISKMHEAIELETKQKFTYREPFATLSHKDMWVNNFMVKLDKGDEIVNNKFVDFQVYSYESPVRDLLFFLFTSVQINALKDNIDYFLDFYYKQFAEALNQLHCPTEEFSFEKFMNEISYYGIHELSHILGMLVFVVLGDKAGSVTKPGELPAFPTKDQISQEVRKRACWIFKEFLKRQWLR